VIETGGRSCNFAAKQFYELDPLHSHFHYFVFALFFGYPLQALAAEKGSHAHFLVDVGCTVLWRRYYHRKH
jgi:hypothetical protein